jgi:hypothetical protein
MAFTDQELASLNAVFDSLPAPVQAMLRTKSTGDTAAAIATVVGRRRGVGMSSALTALVSLTIADWTALKAAAELADGTSLGDSLRAARASFDGEDAAALGPQVMAVLAAAFKNFGV